MMNKNKIEITFEEAAKPGKGGHTFHYQCISRWKARSPTCPQCRVKFKEPIKLFFDLNNTEATEIDSATLKNKLNDLEFKLKEKNGQIKSVLDEHASCSSNLAVKQNEIGSLKLSLQNSLGTNDALKRQLLYLEKFKIEAKRARADAAQYNDKIASLSNIDEMVKGERHDVEAMIKRFADTPDSLNQIATSFIVLKKEFDKLKDSKKKLEHEKKSFRRKAETASQEVYESKEKLKVVSSDLTHLNDINKSLQDKLRKLELSFQSPSPRSSAIKRLLMESPAPIDFKRPRIVEGNEQHEEGDGSLILIDGPSFDMGSYDETDCSRVDNINLEEEQCKELADEFGLPFVATTSMTTQRGPLKDLNKNQSMKSNAITKKVLPEMLPSKLAHVKKGYNGMGGQSKVLILPKKTLPTLRKQTLKNETKKLKIPSRNNTKISNFMKNAPKPSVIELSP